MRFLCWSVDGWCVFCGWVVGVVLFFGCGVFFCVWVGVWYGVGLCFVVWVEFCFVLVDLV